MIFLGFMGFLWKNRFFEWKSREFDEIHSFLGGDKKGVKGGYRGLKKSSGGVFGKRF